uniref:Uncharacterized protein n=1 Tax=Monodon monoceros TaxID=40151 RepID=A0A8C6BUS9_MONMO
MPPLRIVPSQLLAQLCCGLTSPALSGRLLEKMASSGPGHASGLCLKPVPGVGVLPVPAGSGAEQGARRQVPGHRRA